MGTPVSLESTTDPVVYRVRSPRRRSTTARAALGLGALSLLATGVDHLQQYYSADYSTVPTIGTLLPQLRVRGHRRRRPRRPARARRRDAIRALFAVAGSG
jgi:hypothetical protein